MQMHPDQLALSEDAVRELIDAQFPQWRNLPIRPLATEGTVNAIFRVGEGLTARFSLEPGEPAEIRRWLESEAESSRMLLGRTRFPTPEPVAIGEPGAGYPLPWSVQTWIPGTVATVADPAGSVPFALDLAEFIRGVRAIPTGGRTFKGGGRGGVLKDHDDWMATCLDASEGLLDVPRLRRMWAEMRELPRGDDPDVMNHCDLIPGNVLVKDGRLVGLLDVGGFGPADPALDLVSAWHLLDTEPREALRDALGSDDLEWERGRAWAFQQAMGLVWYYVESNPPMSRMGRRTLERLLG